MKPFLLALVVAIPLLISNILATENAGTTDVAPPATSTQSAVAPAATPRRSTSLPDNTAATAKPVPSSHSLPNQVKPMFM